MFEISGIYANSSNLQYLAGVMQKSYDYVANDFTYFFCQDIIPGKTLFSIACEIMKETDAAKAEKLVQKYVTKYKCNVRTALGRDATDREVWKFEEQISNRDKFNYMLNDFRQKVLS